MGVVACNELDKSQPLWCKEISFLSESLAKADFEVATAEGAVLYTRDGRELLDFSSGTLNLPLGYGHPAVIEAAVQQMRTGVQFVSSRWHSQSYIDVAKLLSKLAPGLTVVHHKICCGSDANETAIKIARKWKGRRLVATQYESHLGETCEMHSASGRNFSFKSAIMGSHDFIHFPPPEGRTSDEQAAFEALDPYRGQIAAILVEPVPLHAGLRVFPNTQQYLSGLRRLADLHGALLIFDEVQTFGWTEKLLASNYYKVSPDMVTLAKGVGFGFPIAAVIMHERLRGVLSYNHAELTHGGHVVSCAAAVAGLTTLLKQDFQLKEKGIILERQLQKVIRRYRSIAGLRRFGLIIGITFHGTVEEQNCLADRLYDLTLRRNLIIRRSGNNVILKPPLIVKTEQIHFAVGVLENALSEMES